MRRIAALLGLGFAEKINIGGSRRSLFMRRSSGLTVGAADVSKNDGYEGVQPGSGMNFGSESEKRLELNIEKSLYLCFVERFHRGNEKYSNQVIRSIRLKLINDDDDSGGDKEDLLLVAASKSSMGYKAWANFSCLGSKIIFTRGIDFGQITEFICIDTRPTNNNTIEFASESCSFSTPKYNPLLRGINDKLYCIDSCPYLENPKLHPFEVLDPQDLCWRPLGHPPFISGSKTCDHFNISVLEGSNKIIGWDHFKVGVHCFDITKPENGWTESFSMLGCALPFLDYKRPFIFVHDHHPFLGSFHLMFYYSINSSVLPFYMSDSSCTFIPSYDLPLPELWNEYSDFDADDYSDFDDSPPLCADSQFVHDSPPIYDDSQFVHLGDQKVCLVLNKFFPYGHDFPELGILHLITFKYEIITTMVNFKPTIRIKTRLLRICRFRYRSTQVSKPGHTQTEAIHMTGVFLL